MTTPISNLPQSVEAAVDMLHANMSLNDEILLALLNEEDLIDAHFALGHQIRHEFGFWTDNNALLESCSKLSGDKNLNADTASMMIVNALWERVKKSNILDDHQ
jgi:hypothetical protein